MFLYACCVYVYAVLQSLIGVCQHSMFLTMYVHHKNDINHATGVHDCIGGRRNALRHLANMSVSIVW